MKPNIYFGNLSVGKLLSKQCNKDSFEMWKLLFLFLTNLIVMKLLVRWSTLPKHVNAYVKASQEIVLYMERKKTHTQM